MAVNTPNVSKAWAPDQVSTYTFEDVLGDSLYAIATTKGGEINGDAPSLRVPYVDDSDDADFVAEGAVIPESSPDLDEVILQTRKIAKAVTVSNEQTTQRDTPAVIARSVTRDLIRKLDRALLLQAAPVAPAVAPSTGLVNTPGILDGDAIDTDLDPLVDIIATLRSNQGSPRLLVVDPLAFAHLYKMRKGTGSNEGLLSAATDTPTSPVLGLQVVVNSLLSAHTGLVIDPSAIVSAYSSVSVAQSTDAKFLQDSTVYRATVRCGHVVVKPNRIAKFTIGEA